ncbi:hypothetical protein BC938DRAFT_471930 [Jimgerdemannia flammicorona]|uniref:Ubinuclein middle domain-containing protein n=1 Tax=Jimgerdemannia flammicorona TaxID=994334 RepID=A0A433Q732_9FUNG|nr:hypothetical protein BC938DRAFT_471930 [Jimgerdemannia flammicorona]
MDPSSPPPLFRLPPPPSRVPPPLGLAPTSSQRSRERSVPVYIDFEKHGRIVNYRDLHEQALAEFTKSDLAGSPAPNCADSDGTADAPDSFFGKILEKAKQYAEGEDTTTPTKRRRGERDEYDTNDPFIDDSDMLVDDDYDMRKPKLDGWFAWRGPLEREAEAADAYVFHVFAEYKCTSVIECVITPGGVINSSDAVESSSSRTKKPSRNKLNGTAKENAKGRKSMTDPVSDSDPETGDDRELSKKKTKAGTKSLLSQVLSAGSSPKSKKKDAEKSKEKEKDKPKKSLDVLSPKKPPTLGTHKAKSNHNIDGEVKQKKSKTSSDASLSTSAATMTATPKIVLQPLPANVLEVLNELRVAAAQESFEVRSKFPQNLRPIVVRAAKLMLKSCVTIEDNFIAHLMDILGYNRFTMRKFVAKNAYPEVIEEREAELARLTESFRIQVNDAMAPQLEQYNERVSSIESSMVNASTGVVTPGGHTGDGIEPSPSGSEYAGDVRKELDSAKVRRFKWSDSLKKALFDMMQLETSVVAMKNEHSELAGDKEKLADLTVRKQTYQKLLSFWPEGWMTSTDLSRHFTTYRTKIDPSLTNKRRNVSAPTSPAHGPVGTITQHSPPMSTDHLSVTLPLVGSSFAKPPSTKKRAKVDGEAVLSDHLHDHSELMKRVKADEDTDHHHGSGPSKRIKKEKKEKSTVPKPRGFTKPRKPKDPSSPLSDNINSPGPHPSPPQLPSSLVEGQRLTWEEAEERRGAQPVADQHPPDVEPHSLPLQPFVEIIAKHSLTTASNLVTLAELPPTPSLPSTSTYAVEERVVTNGGGSGSGRNRPWEDNVRGNGNVVEAYKPYPARPLDETSQEQKDD